MPRSRKNLYTVYAGNQEHCSPVYSTTKKNKAYDYLHKVIMKDSRYTKAYVQCVYGHVDDKRLRWKEVDK